MFKSIIIFVTAILISVVAAYFSIAGLAALFAATFWGVVIMGASLELGKVVAATWAHENWSNPRVSRLHKGYLVAAVGALMLITSLGIYGYLSKGHLEQAAPMAGTNLQIQQGELRITQLENDNKRLMTRLDQLDQSVNVMLGNDRATQGLRARSQQKAERDEINSTLTANNTEIQKIQADLLPLKTANLEVEAKLGPVKYVAELFGWEDPEAAVRMIILVIMVAFDPLALVLIISGTITFRQYVEEKKKNADQEKHSGNPVVDLECRSENDSGLTVVGEPDGASNSSDIQHETEGSTDLLEEASDMVDRSGDQLDEGSHGDLSEGRGSTLDDTSHLSFHSAGKVELTKPYQYGHSSKPTSSWPMIKELEENSKSKVDNATMDSVVSESELEEQLGSLDEKQATLWLLERNPEIVQDIIDILENRKKENDQAIRLRDSNNE